MLDAVEAGLDALADGQRRARVGGDLLAGVVGRLGSRLHLGVGGLGIADLLVLAGDAAGDAELDEVGARLELRAGGGAEAVCAVGLDGSPPSSSRGRR